MKKELEVLNKSKIDRSFKENFIDLVLQTLDIDKQVLIFNNSKRNSEATAEKVAKAIAVKSEEKEKLDQLAKKILSALPNPTRQCDRLAKIVKKGAAFHHSGLVAKQRTLIEEAFKVGLIKVISSTPTLAAGLNLPAYQVIVKDYRRYTPRGFNDIPVLEFHQMAGRAGRPGKEDVGVAVVCTSNDDECKRVAEKFIHGESEEIYSKLAVEPILKTYMLSLISMDLINSEEEIFDFFSHTFYAHQFGDIEGLKYNLKRILGILKDYDFLTQNDKYFLATRVGKRVSELYLNPDTAFYFLEYFDKFFKRFSSSRISKSMIFSLVFFVVDTLEMKPLFRVSKAEEEVYVKRAEEVEDSLIKGFDPFDLDYGTFLNIVKTTDVLMDWIFEKSEDYISQKYNVTPGELNYKVSVVDWLFYSLEEFAHLKKEFYFKNVLSKLRLRFKFGVREDLIHLVNLKGVGRVRARKLVDKGFKTVNDLRVAPMEDLTFVLGLNTAKRVKEQIGDETTTVSISESLGKPTNIKAREVSDDEVDLLVENDTLFQKEREEKKRVEIQKNLKSFFN